jgi:uncharacterized protein YchJ
MEIMMATRPKEVLPYLELLAKVQGLLVGCRECRNLHIDSLQVLAEDSDGANWYVARMRQSGDDHDATECRRFVKTDLVQLRMSYDVDPDSPRA